MATIMANTGSSNPLSSTPISNSSPPPSPARSPPSRPHNPLLFNSNSPSRKSSSAPSPPSSASKVSTPWAPVFSSLKPGSSPPTPTSPVATPLSRSEEHTSELQSQSNLVCRLLL